MFVEEMHHFGVTHGDVGRLLAEKWNLPIESVEAISHHHQPFNARAASNITAWVHLADILVQTKGIGLSGNGVIPKPDPVVEPLISSHRATIEEVRESLTEEMDKAEVFVSLCRGA